MLCEGSVLAGVFFATLFKSTRTESTVISHGHRYNAVIVIAVSRELENVLVEQNHCHGLKRVMRSWHSVSKHHAVRDSSLTAAHAVLLPNPYIFSAIFQV